MNKHLFYPRLEIFEDRYTPATLPAPVGMALPANDAPAQTAPAQPGGPAAPDSTNGTGTSTNTGTGTGGRQAAVVSVSFFLAPLIDADTTAVTTGPLAVVSTSFILLDNTGPLGSLPLEATSQAPANAIALGQYPAPPAVNAGGGVSAENANTPSPNPLNVTATSSDASLTGPLSGTSAATTQSSAVASAM